MSAIAMVGATGLLFAVAHLWAKRWGDRLTLCDPAIWVLTIVATFEAAFSNVHHFAAVVILAVAMVCALTDRQTGYIFNAVLVGATILLIPCIVLTGDLQVSILGAGVCGSGMLFLHVATRGRGLGLGDVKLAALIGGGLGLPAGVLSLGAAFVAGALAVVAMALVRRVRLCDAIAFGPYLAVGSMVSVALTELR